ncbi:telomere-protecting terminal protein Tpg [Streptomyces sp. NPDC051546]|uniref:telomere-protecting terminal protein Tpg n=1 Tax=Streptomyces sp. NPDC051546 TaxID=3365655 RepID=UPI00378AAEA4
MKIFDAFKAKVQTRDIPKTARGQFNAVARKEKGDTKKIAERLGISRRQVQRILKGDRKIENSRPETLANLEKQVRRDHQPRIRAKGEAEAKARGMYVHTRAQFGFQSAAGSTDDARYRRLTEDVPDHLIPELFEAARAGDEDRLRELIGNGLAEEYFHSPETPGTAREELLVEFGDIDYIEIEYR